MKFDAAILRTALGRVLPIIERRTTVQILGAVVLSCIGGKATIRGTNMDTHISVEFEGDGDGTIAIRADFLRRLLIGTEGLIETKTRKEKGTTVIDTTGRGFEATINSVYQPEDMPPMPANPDQRTVAIPQPDLVDLLSTALPFISTEETRYYLNGVYLHAHEGKLRAVATDGHSMAILDSEIEWPFPAVIFGRREVATALKLLKRGGNEPAIVSAGNLCLRIKIGDTTFHAKTIDGTYPEYQRVIPTFSDAIRVEINEAMLTRFTTASYDTVKVIPGGHLMQKDRNEGATIMVPVGGWGDPFMVAARLLSRVSHATGTALLTGDAPNAPFRVVGEEPGRLFILMPMRM